MLTWNNRGQRFLRHVSHHVSGEEETIDFDPLVHGCLVCEERYGGKDREPGSVSKLPGHLYGGDGHYHTKQKKK